MFEIVSSITTNRNISMCGLKIQNGCHHKTLFNIWTIWKYEWRFSQKLPYDHFVAISLLYMAGFTKLGKMGDFFSWFHWNRPIPAKRRHFCLRQSYKDCIFSPIIILFLQYSCFWILTHTGFVIQYFIQTRWFALWNVGGHVGESKERLKFC